MKEKLIAKAQELRQHGFTTGEIADELKIKFGSCFNNIEFKSSIYRRNDGRYISDVAICKILEREMDSILSAIKENIRDC